MKKYQVKHKHQLLSEPPIDVYGIWNNDMASWQYIYEWDSNETRDIKKADTVCEQLNIGINT